MWYLIVVFIGFVVFLITNGTDKKATPKKDAEQDYRDEQIMNQTLYKERLKPSLEKKAESVTPIPTRVEIEKYHVTNEIIGMIRYEYIKKYHENEEPVYYVSSEDIDDYIRRFTLNVWNSELDLERHIVSLTLEDLISQCESQFKIWANKVEKKNSPEYVRKRLQANRKYLSENKRKLKELDNAATYKEHQALLSEMQLRYNEIIASDNTLKKELLQELKDLGIKDGTIENPIVVTPDLIFEVKGLTYRSAQAQLKAVLLEVGDQLLLEEEPDNEVDASAVKVLIPASGECIGYVEREHCVIVGALINRIDNCTVIKKSHHQIPYITAKISFKK